MSAPVDRRNTTSRDGATPCPKDATITRSVLSSHASTVKVALSLYVMNPLAINFAGSPGTAVSRRICAPVAGRSGKAAQSSRPSLDQVGVVDADHGSVPSD